MTAEAYFEEGKKCYEEGRYEEALECFDEAIRLDGNYTDPWDGKATLYIQLKDYQQALLCFEEIIQRDDNDFYPWQGKGYLYKIQKDYEQALICYDEAIRLSGNKVINFLRNKANSCDTVNEDVAINLGGIGAYPWYGKGFIYETLKEYELALYCYDEAIRLDKKSAASWAGKGYACTALNDYTQALFCFDEAIRLGSNGAYTWKGKGYVCKHLGDYEKALLCFDEAIRRDSNDADCWYGKGIVYIAIKEYEQALSCFEESILRDENYAPPWNGKGNVYYDLQNYEQALNCYSEAIWRNESLAESWNGKGNVYCDKGDYESSKSCITRAFFLKEHIAILYNSLRLFSIYPFTPFYTYRLIVAYLSVDEYQERKLLVKMTAEQCRTIQAYIAWLQLSRRQDKLPSAAWQSWLAQVFYFMGDPVKSYEKLKVEVLKDNPNDLSAWYYLLKSCQGFAEPTDPFMKEAIAVAEQYPLKQSNTAWGTQKQVLSAEEIRQHYYAGLLHYEDEEPELAIECFRAIKDDFLPAAYMLLYLLHQAGDDVQQHLRDIHRRESRLSEGEMSFARGFYPQHLDLDREDFLTPFQHYSHYWEIADAIDLFTSLAPKDTGFVPESSSEAKAFWSAWFLEEKDYQRIFKKAREYHLEVVTDEIIHDRSLVYDFMSGTVTDATPPSEKVVQSSANKIGDLLERTYRELLLESNAEERERRLGNMVTEWPFNKPEYYQRLSTALFLQDLLTEKQKVHLDFYAHIQYYVRQKPSDVLFAGAKDVFKEVIDKAITPLLATAGGWPGAALSIFLKPLAKGMLAELIVKHLKSGEAPFKTYTDFKEGFKVFIGEEKKRLEDKFEERYPMYGFEEWVG